MSVTRPVEWFLVCHLCHEGRRDWGSRLTPMWVMSIPLSGVIVSGQWHMLPHLKVWSLDEWGMPTALTGASTSSGADYCWWLRDRWVTLWCSNDILALRSVGCPAPPLGCLRDLFCWYCHRVQLPLERRFFFFPALPSEYETLSVNNWKYAKESNSLEQTCKK